MDARPNRTASDRWMAGIYLASAALILLYPARCGADQTLQFFVQIMIALLLDALYCSYHQTIDLAHPPLAVRSLIALHTIRFFSPSWTSASGFNALVAIEYFLICFSVICAAIEQLVFAGYLEMDGYRIKNL